METTITASPGASADDGTHRSVGSHVWNETTAFIQVGYGGASIQNLSAWCRFLSVEIPVGATITAAKLTLTAQATDALDTVVGKIEAENVGNAGVPDHTEFDAFNRTAASVAWNPLPDVTAESTYDTPDFAAVIQEIVNRPDWVPGNAITVYVGDHDEASTQVDDTRRIFYSYDDDSAKAPVLTVTFVKSIMTETNVTVEIRQPFPPHALLTLVRYSALSYGFLLGGVGSASFGVSRADDALLDTPGFFQEGKAVTIRRSDGALPWAGYITGTRISLDDPVVQFECQEASGALFEWARTAQKWSERQLSASQWLRWAFADVNGRGNPPLLVQLAPFEGGPAIKVSPQASSFRSFLDTIAEFADWEWSLHHRLGRQTVVTELVLQERIGRDYTSELIFEEGVHFTGAELVRDVTGFIQSSLAVGGSGTFRERPSVQVVQTGSGETGVTTQRQSGAVSTSPAKAGSRLVIEPSVTNEPALRASARRQYRSSANVGERMVLGLYEDAINIHQLALGGVYRVRFDDLNMGQPLERRVRVLGIKLGVDGVVEAVVERA